MFPYRDWLSTLGSVVLVLQWSVLSYWGMTYVWLLRGHGHRHGHGHTHGQHISGDIIKCVNFTMCRIT